MHISGKFKEFIECILRKNGIKATWELIIFDNEEWELYSNQWEIYRRYIDDYIVKHKHEQKEEEPEWPDYDTEEHFTSALCCPSEEVRTIIDIIERDLNDLELKKSCKDKTSFLRDVVNFSEADYLIIINSDEFIRLFLCEYPLTIAHETIHIIDSYNPKRHPGKWVDGQAAKYTLKCMDKLEDIIKKDLLEYNLRNGKYKYDENGGIVLEKYDIPE